MAGWQRKALVTPPRANRSARSAPLKGAAAAEGVPYSTVRAAGLRGEFPIIRIGRALYVHWTDFERWIEAQKERG